MTEDMKVTAEQIRGIEGMENYEESSAVAYFKILNGSAALELELPAGTMINSVTNAILAKKGEPFNFIPLYYFRRYTIWDKKTRKLEKFAFSKKGRWSDGTVIEFEDTEWVGKTPPRAQESLEFVVLPVDELDKPEEDRRWMIMSFGFTNKVRPIVAKRLEQLIYQTCINEKVTKMYACEFSITSKKETKGEDTWFEYSNPLFVKKNTKEVLAIGAALYNDVKGLNTVNNVALIENNVADMIPENVSSNTDF